MQTKIEASISGTVNNTVNRQLTDFMANSMVDRIHSFENCWGTHKYSIFKPINNTIFQSHLEMYTDNLIAIEPTFH